VPICFKLTLEEGLSIRWATGAKPIMAMHTPAITASLALLMRVRCGVIGGIWFALDCMECTSRGKVVIVCS